MSNEWAILIQEYGAIATGTSAIIATSIILYRKVFKPMFQAIKQYNNLCEKVDVIFYEITPNGGTSIKDTVNIISKDLNEISEMQKALSADAKEALFKTDSEGNCNWINRTYARTVQRTPPELMGHGWQNSIAKDDREHVVKAWYTAVEEDRELTLNFRFETPDGEMIPARLRSYKMTDSKGEIIGYVGSIITKGL
jgi:PAS domain S-box-containing protein